MQLLLKLQEIRNPFLNQIILLATQLGGTAALLGVLCISYWCINKKFARKLAVSFFLAGMITQILKITFRVERPFNRWSEITQIEGAGATGYSFPSGHTQSATSLYITVALQLKRCKNKIRIPVFVVCILAILITAFTRLYLGVHTLQDVLVSIIIALFIAIVIDFVFEHFYNRKNGVVLISAVMFVISLGTLIYTTVLFAANTVPAKELVDVFNSCSSGLALAISMPLEDKYVGFDPKKGSLLYKISRTAIGVVLLLTLKTLGEKLIGIGEEAESIHGWQIILSMILYFFMIIFAFGIYPTIMKNIGIKLDAKKEKKA